MGLGEKIFDLFAGTDIPVRNTGCYHLLFCSGRQTLALTDRFHDLECALIRHATGNQINHDIVTGADCLVNSGCLGIDQILCITQPHVRTVGVATDSHQEVKFGGQSIQQNAAGKAGIELRNAIMQ